MTTTTYGQEKEQRLEKHGKGEIRDKGKEQGLR